MATDPVCGMDVKDSGPLKAEFKGTVYRFCSPVCKKRFETSPAAFSRMK